ncbi:MAG: 4-hydroxy-tetrahydrodipicolinate reductase [Pseudomonadota bacterium]
MKTVGVSGANGVMGRLTINAIEATDGLSVAWLYAPGHGGEQILGHAACGDAAKLSACDVIIELTHPAAADENLPRWQALGTDVVVGTSGYTEARLGALRDAWSDHDARCLIVPNFSIGAVLMMRFAEQAAPFFESAEIVEMHRHDKPDAPSGTALHTAARIGSARQHAAHNRGSEIVAGALGADVDGVAVHSLRLHGTAAHQEVILGTVGQYLTLRHDTSDYQCFVPGIVLALQRAATLEAGVTVGLEHLLDL